MKVIVRFIRKGRVIKHPVTVQFLEEEMDAIEYNNQGINDFKWVPHREQQEKFIRESMDSMYVDPVDFSWKYKRALIEQSEKMSLDKAQKEKHTVG